MRKLLASLLLIAVVVALVAGATWASFSDFESDSATITAGTLDDLKIDLGDSATSEWNLTKVIPGSDTSGVDKVSGSVTLCVNPDPIAADIAADHLEIQAFLTIDEGGFLESDTDSSSTAAEMAAKVEITAMVYDPNGAGIDLLDGSAPDLADADGDSVKTLNDLSFDPDGGTPNGLDDLTVPADCDVDLGSFTMTVKWIEGSDDNDFQGDELTTEIRFTINQEASQ